jgi:hypothetical protein
LYFHEVIATKKYINTSFIKGKEKQTPLKEQSNMQTSNKDKVPACLSTAKQRRGMNQPTNKQTEPHWKNPNRTETHACCLRGTIHVQSCRQWCDK